MIEPATNSGASASCAWPGCPLARSTFRRVEPRPGVGELLPSCARHTLRPDDEALRVWRDLVGRKPPTPVHVDDALLAGLVKELRRRGSWTMRSQLVAWARMQRAADLHGQPRPEGTAGTLDAETDALSALDALVRDGRAKCRRLPEGDAAYHLVEEDEECSTTTTETTTTTSASLPTKSRSTSPDAATRGTAHSATPKPPPKPARPSVPPVEAAAPAAPAVDSNDSEPCSEPESGGAGRADAAPPRATTTTVSPSDEEPPMDSPTTLPERALAFLREHPGAETPAVTAALGCDDGTRPKRWTATDAPPPKPPAAKPSGRQSPAREELVAYLQQHPGSTKREIADGLGRSTKWVENTVAAAENGRAPGLFVETGGRWTTTGGPTRTPPGTESTDELDRLRAEKAVWIQDEVDLREWRCQVEAALGFDDDNHAPVAAAVQKIELLRSLADDDSNHAAWRRAVERGFGHDAPVQPSVVLAAAQGLREAAERPTPVAELVDGVPYPAALRLVAEVAGVEPGPGVLARLVRAVAARP